MKAVTEEEGKRDKAEMEEKFEIPGADMETVRQAFFRSVTFSIPESLSPCR